MNHHHTYTCHAIHPFLLSFSFIILTFLFLTRLLSFVLRGYLLNACTTVTLYLHSCHNHLFQIGIQISICLRCLNDRIGFMHEAITNHPSIIPIYPPSHPIPSHPIPSHPIPSFPFPSYPILSYPILSHHFSTTFVQSLLSYRPLPLLFMPSA